MKTVFQNHSQVCHAFNLQNHFKGRAGNIFFEGNKIFSYGYHYCMGEFIDSETILINNKGYSNSTAKHISILAQATRDKKQIYLKHIELNIVLNELESLYKSLMKARKPLFYRNSIEFLYSSFMNTSNNLGGFYYDRKFHHGFMFVEFGKMTKEDKQKINRVNEIRNLANDYAATETYKRKVERAKELEATKEQREKEKREKQRKEQIENFYTYKGSRVNWLEYDILRLSKCGEFVETSQAVRIPLKEAQRYFNLFKSGSKLIGEKIEHYTTISNEGFLKIGCHKIEHKEANRIGNLITQ